VTDFDKDLYDRCVDVTHRIAKEKGIMWEQEQPDILYAVITGGYLDELKPSDPPSYGDPNDVYDRLTF